MRRKRDDFDVDSVVGSINQDNGLVHGLLQLDPNQLATLLAHIANEASIATTTFKKARIELPSFSVAKWSKFAEQFGLPKKVSSALQLEPFTTPKYRLPLSLQEAMFENAWRWHDVYREKVDHTREEARVRILDPYIVPIVALFQGRVIDKPEEMMTKTVYSTGGEVEHKIFIMADILFFVIELRLGTPDENGLAQLFLELLLLSQPPAAAEMNKEIDFKGLRVYGLLTDLVQFKFYSYDPATNQFCFDEIIIINTKRIDAFSDMMEISNKIFGVVLSGYMDSLRAYITKSKDRVKRNQTGCNIPSSSKKPSELTGEGKSTAGRRSIDQWEAALVLAESCCAKFKKPAANLPDIEENANEALRLLTESVRSIPRASIFTGGGDDPSTPAELKMLATRIAKETYEHYL